jgi:large subunit ribosomal protein LP1
MSSCNIYIYTFIVFHQILLYIYQQYITKTNPEMTLSNDELACVYAALILADDNVDIKGEKIASILKAANYEIEPYWPGLFAGALEGVKVTDLIKNIGSAPVATGAPVQAATTTAAADDKKAAAGKEAVKKEEKKVEKDDSDEGEDMGFGLFD